MTDCNWNRVKPTGEWIPNYWLATLSNPVTVGGFATKSSVEMAVKARKYGPETAVSPPTLAPCSSPSLNGSVFKFPCTLRKPLPYRLAVLLVMEIWCLISQNSNKTACISRKTDTVKHDVKLDKNEIKIFTCLRHCLHII